MDWGPYAVGGAAARPDSFTGLQPEFATSVYQMVQDAQDQGIPLQITSAYRSPEVQARLYEAALKKYGSPEASRKWVAPPGNSQHNFGTAVDLAVNNSLIRDADSPEARWIAQNAPNYGLDVPMSWEPWQVEQAGARGAPQGGTQMARPPVSGTPTMSTQGQAEEEPLPFFQRPGVGNALDSLAIALQGMTIDPNETLMQMSANRIADRRKTARTEQQQNRAADWLESQGMTAAAQGVRSGAIGARDALAMARGGEATAAQRNYDFMISKGVPPEQAMERAFGGRGDVNVNTGDQRPQVGTIKPGWQLFEDPETGAYRMEPIPGGPAAAEAESAEEAAAKRGSQATRAAGVVLEDIDALQETLRKSKLPITGAIGSLVRNIPGTDAYDASAMIQTIAGNIGFDRLQQMREASPTGGALGAVSERELSTLQSVLGSLDQAQSQAQFERNLNRLEDIYTEIMRKASAYPNANDFGFGGQGGAAPQGGGGPRIRYDAEGNRIQ